MEQLAEEDDLEKQYLPTKDLANLLHKYDPLCCIGSERMHKGHLQHTMRLKDGECKVWFGTCEDILLARSFASFHKCFDLSPIEKYSVATWIPS